MLDRTVRSPCYPLKLPKTSLALRVVKLGHQSRQFFTSEVVDLAALDAKRPVTVTESEQSRLRERRPRRRGRRKTKMLCADVKAVK